MEGRRGRGPAALCLSRAGDCNWAADTRTPGPGRTPDAGGDNSRSNVERAPRSAISSANCPWEQDGGPRGSDATRPGVRAAAATNQSRSCGQAIPFPGCARRLRAGSAAVDAVPACWLSPGSLAFGGKRFRHSRCSLACVGGLIFLEAGRGSRGHSVLGECVTSTPAECWRSQELILLRCSRKD